MAIVNLRSNKKSSASQTATSVRPARDVFDARYRTVAWIIRDVHRLYTFEGQKILSSENVTIAHWYYLRVLAEHRVMNQLELSKKVGIASATAVPALDSLEKQGFVKRSRDPNDRRKYDVSLTEAGEQLIDRLMPRMVEMLLRSVDDATPDEMQVFWKVLQQIQRNLFNASSGESGID